VETQLRGFEPPIKTARVSLIPSQELVVTDENKLIKRGIFNILSCDTSNCVDIEYFIVLMDSFLSGFQGKRLSIEDLIHFFKSMSRLFAASPARDLESERQGLWGELFLMDQVIGFTFWAPFWHTELRKLFDFSCENKHVEVKTTLNTERTHHFSHKQIFGLSNEEIIIVSILLRLDGEGLSLRELIERGRTALKGSPNYIKLEHAVVHSGMVDNSVDGPKYSFALALMGIKFFNAIDVPHFGTPEPFGVSETRYKVDLSITKNLGPNEFGRWLKTWSQIDEK
jgi:hypothetical protein